MKINRFKNWMNRLKTKKVHLPIHIIGDIEFPSVDLDNDYFMNREKRRVNGENYIKVRTH